MKYTLEIQKIIFQVEDNHNLTPKDKIRMLKQAIAIADENEDIEWGFDLRVMLLQECYHVASNIDLVMHFYWILNAYEEHPDWFDESDFLWQYKWVLRVMYDNPDVSMEQITSIINDFKARLTRNGYSLRPYYDRLYKEALTLCQFDKAKEYLDLRNDAPDDAMGNCKACTLDDELDYYLKTGNFDEAYKRAQPILDKQLTCGLVPARTLCTLTYYAWKADKPDLAAELFERADTEMELLENDENLIPQGGMMISYLADKNKDKARYYIEKCLPWTLEANGFNQYDFAAYMVEALNNWEEEKIYMELPVEFEFYAENGNYPVKELKAYFYQKARTLAEAFDKRDGYHAYTQRVENL